MRLQTRSTIIHAMISSTPQMDALTLHDDMRKLWTDHVFWTRLYLIEAIAGLPQADASLKRLLQNQRDLGNALQVFYGPKVGDLATRLLTEHITTAGEAVHAAATKNQIMLADALTRWYRNADQIAAALASINPYWSRDDLRAMMREHLNRTWMEALAIMASDGPRSVALYDNILADILAMADTMSDGITKQMLNAPRK